MPLWGYVGIGSALVGALGGWTVRDWKADAEAAEVQQALVEARDKAQKQADDQSVAYETTRAENAATARISTTTIREIYRDVEVPAACEPDPDAVRLLDNALARTAPTASEPSGTVSGASPAS
jgi:hypothetical protein